MTNFSISHLTWKSLGVQITDKLQYVTMRKYQAKIVYLEMQHLTISLVKLDLLSTCPAYTRLHQGVSPDTASSLELSSFVTHHEPLRSQTLNVNSALTTIKHC